MVKIFEICRLWIEVRINNIHITGKSALDMIIEYDLLDDFKQYRQGKITSSQFCKYFSHISMFPKLLLEVCLGELGLNNTYDKHSLFF